eukprot:gene8009-8207_t
MGSSERSNDLAVAVPPHDAREIDVTTDSTTGLHQRRAIGASTTTADEHNTSVTSAGSPPLDVETAVSNGGQGHGKDVNNDAGAAADGVAAQDEQQFADVSYLDITKQFFILGWTAFGGPAAHIGLFQKRFVDSLKWMSASVYGELFALGQCMPGPTSTQVSFAIGTVKKGVRGGLLSGALFQYPGAFIMTAVGVLAAEKLSKDNPWLNAVASGVGAVGVALVASAAKGMATKLCATRLLAIICTGAAIIAYYWPKAYTFPSLIGAGGLITLLWSMFKKEQLPPMKAYDSSIRSHGLSMFWGAMLLFLWVAVLIVTVVLGSTLNNVPLPLKWWEVFYRTGSIIYGGGQVVLPMLYTDVVQQSCDDMNNCVDLPNTWVTSKQFYAGLGVVQALPGPLFNFSAYLGAIIAMRAGYNFAIGSVLAWFGLFSPGILIIFGIMPYWGKFRQWEVYRRALPGLNAAGVGLIVASVFSLMFGALSVSDFQKTSLCIGVIAFTAVDQLKIFEPAVVLGGVVLGVIAHALNME